ncbi:GNAT family N-acetyltransferase [Halobacillus sp. A1]|uniref:GNAT family N-acetyltransferase n=1 Tax=Halobacillus sp. A1 TaxID=2880262 RepID=UPI0020A62991|nr:GNAT family protein [Halobacillus sp. A1]MCP3031556.1 GNAT family N-acetyltransferase [Halobacillus sp. A1]
MSNVLESLPSLETEHLVLRKIDKKDTNDIYSYCSNSAVSRYVTWDTHTCKEETESFIDCVLDGYKHDHKALWGMELKATGKIVGTIDFVSIDEQHMNAEIGYVLSEVWWGRGLTTEASKRLIQFGFTELKLERIQARCMAENIGSQKVMEKAGMSFEGTSRKGFFSNGTFHDIKNYSILREEFK